MTLVLATMAKVAVLLFVCVAAGHAPPKAGIYKNTIAASKPLLTTLPWLLRHLPVFSSPNSCANETCRCGETGRTEIKGTSGFEPWFGIHTVRAAGVNNTREAASGPLSVHQIELIWDEAIGNLGDEDYAYSPWLDHHLALWAPSLDPYVTRFDADGTGYLRRSWRAEGTTYFSLVVHAPATQLVIELISNHTTIRPPRQWPLTQETRHFFQGQAPPATHQGRLFPLHVSRGVTDLGKVEDFYLQIFNVTPTIKKNFQDGTHVAVFGGSGHDSFSPRVGLQFVQRPLPLTTEGRHSVAWFQEYLLNVSKKYMTNYKSCWPVWGDNHIALFMNESLEVLVSRLNAFGSTLYHPFKGVGGPPGVGGPSVVYLVDPSGWAVQARGHWPEGFLPDADTDNGGFDGYCYTFCDHQAEQTQQWVI